MLLTDTRDPLLAALAGSGLMPRGERVLVAVSGGPDSTALLVAARELGHDVVAAHYDHALQAGSAAAAEHVARMCGSLGVELIAERRDAALARGSVQAAARELRYEFLERALVRSHAGRVAIAHTADDLVEGVVMHMMRGCGLAGLRGMPASRGAFVRPLLSVWRQEILQFLDRREIVALDDPANASTAYARVRVRREILPALELARPGISRRFFAVARRAAVLQASIADDVAQMLGAAALSRSVVAGAAEPVAAELMRQLYVRGGGAEPSLARVHVKAMLALARPGPGGRGVDLPGKLRLRIVGETMEIVKWQTPGVPSGGTSPRLEVAACPGCQNDPHAAHLNAGLPLRLGFRTPGLTMRPRGGRGTRKLQDIFVDAKVPREDRDLWPLVFAGDRLAWVPGIAVDADLSSPHGAVAQHVSVVPSPMFRKSKIAVLESPHSPPGEPT